MQHVTVVSDKYAVNQRFLGRTSAFLNPEPHAFIQKHVLKDFKLYKENIYDTDNLKIIQHTILIKYINYKIGRYKLHFKAKYNEVLNIYMKIKFKNCRMRKRDINEIELEQRVVMLI